MATSVVVVTYRTGEVLFSCLSSLLDQTGIERVFVVDNGNPGVVVDRLRALASADARVELLSGHGNIGYARACNLAAARVESEFLMFLNPDCILAPDMVKTLCAEARRLPEPFLIAPRLVNPDGSEQRGGRREVLTPWLALVEMTKLYKLAPNHPYFKRFNQHEMPIPDSTTRVNVTTGACMLMRRSTFEELGGFDPQYFLHVEDIDLCVVLLRRGGSAYVCPSVSLVHYGQSSQVSRAFVEWHKTRSFCYYFRKNFEDDYPIGFVSVVNFAVMVRFFVVAPMFLVSDFFLKRKVDPNISQRQPDVI